MPNWCENEIRVVKNVGNFQRFIKDFTEKGFECVMPIPREMKDPNEIVYWCSENWGTKGIGGDIIVSKNKESIYFDTAWSPPSDQILMQISIVYGVDFRLTFFETGCAFEGMAVVKGGYITKKVFVPDYMDSRYIDEILEIEGDNIMERLETDAEILLFDRADYEEAVRLIEERKWDEAFKKIYSS